MGKRYPHVNNVYNPTLHNHVSTGVRLAGDVGPSRVALQQELAAAVRRMPPAQAHLLVGQAAGSPGVRLSTAGEDGVVRVLAAREMVS